MVIETGLGNYYGDVVFAERNGEYVMELGDGHIDGMQGIVISKEFYEAALKEFGKNADIHRD